MTYAIQSITIKDFKSIAELTLDLGRVNVLIGENGAGKSNILEAIGVLSAAVSGNTSYASLKERGIRLSAPEVFKLALKKQKRKPRFALDANFTNGAQYHLTLSPERDGRGDSIRYWAESLTDKGQKIASWSHSKGQMKIQNEPYEKPSGSTSMITTLRALNVAQELFSFFDILQRFAIYAPSTPVLRNITTDESIQSPLGLYGGSLPTALKEMFRGDRAAEQSLVEVMFMLFPWLQGFGGAYPNKQLVSHHVHPGPFVVAFTDKRMSESFNRLFAYDVSEGALYALFLLVLILHKSSPAFFAIDNMDSALNPRLAQALLAEAIKLAQGKPNKQIILTTHNPSMLNALDLFDDTVRLFVVERSQENGSTIVRRINPAAHMSREQWKEGVQGNTLASLWTAGSMGGLPNI